MPMAFWVVLSVLVCSVLIKVAADVTRRSCAAGETQAIRRYLSIQRQNRLGQPDAEASSVPHGVRLARGAPFCPVAEMPTLSARVREFVADHIAPDRRVQLWNELSGEVAFETRGASEVPNALARIALASGFALTIVAVLAASPPERPARLLWGFAPLVVFLVTAGTCFWLGRLARSGSRARREAWAELARVALAQSGPCQQLVPAPGLPSDPGSGRNRRPGVLSSFSCDGIRPAVDWVGHPSQTCPKPEDVT